MNEVIFIVSMLLYLLAVVAMYYFFGRTGLYVFTAFSTVLANIQVCKNIDLFGVATTCGNVLYAASFLVTDILSEKYGKKSAQRAVYIGLSVTVMWLIGTAETLRFAPNSSDLVSDAMNQLFGLVPRVACGSFIAYTISQSIDVFLYHRIWEKTGNGKGKLWMRNNFSTMTSQLIDTLVFTTIAFWGVYTTDIFISICVTTYLFKVVVALCDTPFMYLAQKIHTRDSESRQTEEQYEAERNAIQVKAV